MIREWFRLPKKANQVPWPMGLLFVLGWAAVTFVFFPIIFFIAVLEWIYVNSKRRRYYY